MPSDEQIPSNLEDKMIYKSFVGLRPDSSETHIGVYVTDVIHIAEFIKKVYEGKM